MAEYKIFRRDDSLNMLPAAVYDEGFQSTNSANFDVTVRGDSPQTEMSRLKMEFEKFDDLKRELKIARTSLFNLSKECDLLRTGKDEMLKLERDSVILKDIVHDLNITLESQKLQISSQSEEIINLTMKYSKANSNLDHNQECLKIAQSDVVEKQRRIDSLQELLISKNDENVIISGDLFACRQSLNSLKEEIILLKEETDVYKKENVQLVMKINLMQNEFVKLLEIEKDFETLKSDLEASRYEVTCLLDAVQQSETILKNQKDESEQLIIQIEEDMKQRLKESEDKRRYEVSNLSTEIEKLKGIEQDLSDEALLLEDQIHEYVRRVRGLDKQLFESLRKNSAEQELLDLENLKIQDLESRIEIGKTELQRLEQESDKIGVSTDKDQIVVAGVRKSAVDLLTRKTAITCLLAELKRSKAKANRLEDEINIALKKFSMDKVSVEISTHLLQPFFSATI